jgi:flagellar basal-body rod modification protein FlgD
MDAASALAAAQPKASTSSFTQLTENFDTFITLLTSQLRNQDPLDPLDTEKFTSQLVQFSGVEQSIKTNAHLEALIALQSGSDRGDAAALVGKTVTLADARARHDGAGATWRFAPPAEAVAVSVAVADASGAIVAQGAQPAAATLFAWNGKRADGSDAPAGVYTLTATAVGADGAAAPLAVSSDHRATAVAFGASGASVETAIGAAPLTAVLRIGANQE